MCACAAACVFVCRAGIAQWFAQAKPDVGVARETEQPRSAGAVVSCCWSLLRMWRGEQGELVKKRSKKWRKSKLR